LDNETKNLLKAAFKEPYPRNLFLTLAADKWYSIQISVDDITEDMIAGLEYALSTLPPRDQKVIEMRYAQKMTYTAIAKEFDVTGERIRTLEHRSISKLHHPPLIGYIKYGKRAYEERCDKLALEKEQRYSEDKYQRRISELNISVRPINRLIAKGYETVKDIVELTEDEIVGIKDLGKKSIIEVAVELENLGITNTNWGKFIPNRKEEK